MIQIRVATPADAEAISRVQVAAIRSQCADYYDARQIETWAGRRTPEFYERVLETQEIFVAEREGTVVGFGQIDLEAGQVMMVYVAPEAAHQGVGAALLGHLEAVARQHGWSTLHLTASLNAVPFFEKLGYQTVGPFTHRVSGSVALESVEMKKAGI